MSDIDDDDFDDFDIGDYFYVEDTSDEVGELAEHAIASPVPFDYGDDDSDWDRFAYWNDIEYDSDGYHDVANRSKRRKNEAGAAGAAGKETEAGTLKRKRKGPQGTPSKKRRIASGAAQAASDGPAAPLLSPVGWRTRDKSTGPPIPDKPSTNHSTFSLLKNWREIFPEPTSSASSPNDNSAEGKHEPLEIDASALEAALRANLSSLTGGAGASLGLDESVLLQHITRMLSSGGASADDIAGELADALFAGDEGSVADTEGAEDEGGDENAFMGATDEPSPPQSLEEDVQMGASSKPKHKMPVSPNVPAGRRPLTPSSTATSNSAASGSQGTPKKKDSLIPAEEPDVSSILHAAGVMPMPRGRKRKHGPGDDEGADGDADANEHQVTVQPKKRVATRGFDRPTKSSAARTVSAASEGTKGPAEKGKGKRK